MHTQPECVHLRCLDRSQTSIEILALNSPVQREQNALFYNIAVTCIAHMKALEFWHLNRLLNVSKTRSLMTLRSVIFC